MARSGAPFGGAPRVVAAAAHGPTRLVGGEGGGDGWRMSLVHTCTVRRTEGRVEDVTGTHVHWYTRALCVGPSQACNTLYIISAKPTGVGGWLDAGCEALQGALAQRALLAAEAAAAGAAQRLRRRGGAPTRARQAPRW